jgi:tetratricopeptide (TPR) repeat protein
MNLYDHADALIHSGDAERVREGVERLRQHADAHPDDAVAWFQYGGGLDYTDHEAEAMVAYECAFALGVEGLDPDDRPRIYVQAGSTLRNLGRLDEARTLLKAGQTRFPGVRALIVFQALVEVSAGRDRAAIDLLFEVILSEGAGDDSIAQYTRALSYYANEVRSILP